MSAFRRDALAIAHAELSGIHRGHVDVPFGHDEAALQPQFPVAVAEGDARRPLDLPESRTGGLHPRATASVRETPPGTPPAQAPAPPRSSTLPWGPLRLTRSAQTNCPGWERSLTRLELIAHAEELIHARPAQVDMAPTGLYLHSDPPDHRFGQTFYLMCSYFPPSA